MEIGEEAAEVLVAGAVFDEERNVEGSGVGKGGGEFDGGSYQSTESVFLSGEVSAGGSVDAHVIGECDGLIAELGSPTHEILRLARATEEGEGGKGVEFGEQERSEGVGESEGDGMKKCLNEQYSK